MTIDSTTFCASDGASVGIYRADPPGSDPRPGLLMFPSIFGITAELESHADEIAATGVIVVAFDPFSRGDAGGLGEGDRQRAIERMAGVDFERMNRDFRELLAALKADSACNGLVAGLGICLGGQVTLHQAMNPTGRDKQKRHLEHSDSKDEGTK